MSQQPPEWWARQRGPRFGCADVTIVSVASIAAFVIIIFVLLRPDSQRVVDVTNSGGPATVGVVRVTDTPNRAQPGTLAPTSASGGSQGQAAVTTAAVPATLAPTPFPPSPTPGVPTVTPAPAYRLTNLRDECRLRKEPSTQATVIQIFKSGVSFRVYPEQRYDGTNNWVKVEPDDGSGRIGWMWSVCV